MRTDVSIAPVTVPPQIFTADKITAIVDTAIRVVEERFRILQDTARGVVEEYIQETDNCCLKTLAYVRKLKEGPDTSNKVFLADLIVAATRVWEAFSKNADGKNQFYFSRSISLIDSPIFRELLFCILGHTGRLGTRCYYV